MPEWAVAPPTLIVVSGPAGAGKTTLAHTVAAAVGCPAVCRDEIKEGMVHATPSFVAGPADPLTQRAYTTFFETLALLLNAGVTVVAEAAFQNPAWRRGLDPLTDLASIRILQCIVGPDIAHARISQRLHSNPLRAAHNDHSQLQQPSGPDTSKPFVRLSLPAPTLTVDTTDGYQPSLTDILTFINTPHRNAST
jgi:predicted kinase